MATELKMPALSPTMEEGTLAKWLVKRADIVRPGDILAEIETDKATMEFEAVDDGTIAELLVAEGTDGVKVGAPIAILADGSEAEATALIVSHAPETKGEQAASLPAAVSMEVDAPPAPASKCKISPLARRIAHQRGIDISRVQGTGANGRIVKADLEALLPQRSAAAREAGNATPPGMLPPSSVAGIPPIPHDTAKLSNMRKTIARRLTESKQQVPHIYLTVDVRLDALLSLRAELNAGLASRGIRLSVNDLIIKAQALALIEVPSCNVMLAGDQLVSFSRADISVAVSILSGLITPVVRSADTKSVSAIAIEMNDLAARARDGKLQPDEYQGGTASLSNMGMLGIKQFEAVINPPQGMILAIGAGEKRPHVVDGGLAVATMMSATGSFDHRAIDGADGAQFLRAFKEMIEDPIIMVA